MRWANYAEAKMQEEAPRQAQSSSAVWAASEQEGPRMKWVGVGVGTSYITHTHFKVRRAFCLPEGSVYLSLPPLPT